MVLRLYPGAGLTWSEAPSCLVLITVAVPLPRMRKLRPEGGSACQRHPEGLGRRALWDPVPSSQLGPFFLCRDPGSQSYLVAGLQERVFGPPAWVGLAGPGQQRRGNSYTLRASSPIPQPPRPARQSEGAAASCQHPGVPIGCLTPFNPHNSPQWDVAIVLFYRRGNRAP